MTQQPVSPTFTPNFEFIEQYIDCLEHLPLGIQRCVTQLREYDLLYRTKLDQIGRFLHSYKNETTGAGKRKFLNKIQKCLIKSQQLGDEKLNIISQIVELIETRSHQLSKDAECADMEGKEENRTSNGNGNCHRTKIEKPAKISNEKITKNIYEKPKRVRRVRTTEKSTEKVDRNLSRFASKEEDEEDEDEEMEEEEEIEIKPKKESKKKEKDKAKEKEKEKDKVKEEKEEKKEERKSEKKEKYSGKVTKKTNTKHVASKVKKKKKKEKESAVEDLPLDPDEPTYCVCNSISYGDMIGCDNDDCEIEWFHFGCVNLTHKPKGKWYCPRCSAERKEKAKK